MKSAIARFTLALLSAGWLLPLWASVSVYLDFMNSDIWPAVLGHPRMNSFPYLMAAKSSFTITCLWLGLVVFFWSLRALKSTGSKGAA